MKENKVASRGVNYQAVRTLVRSRGLNKHVRVRVRGRHVGRPLALATAGADLAGRFDGRRRGVLAKTTPPRPLVSPLATLMQARQGSSPMGTSMLSPRPQRYTRTINAIDHAMATAGYNARATTTPESKCMNAKMCV